MKGSLLGQLRFDDNITQHFIDLIKFFLIWIFSIVRMWGHLRFRMFMYLLKKENLCMSVSVLRPDEYSYF